MFSVRVGKVKTRHAIGDYNCIIQVLVDIIQQRITKYGRCQGSLHSRVHWESVIEIYVIANHGQG